MTGDRDRGTSQREVATLFYIDDLGIEEIAQILNVTVGTVKSQLAGARDHMRSRLQRDGRAMSLDDDSIRAILSEARGHSTDGAGATLEALRPAMRRARLRRHIAAGSMTDALLGITGAGVVAVNATRPSSTVSTQSATTLTEPTSDTTTDTTTDSVVAKSHANSGFVVDVKNRGPEEVEVGFSNGQDECELKARMIDGALWTFVDNHDEE